MKRKSFSVFFWIFVVLVAVLLFFVMGRNKEGFLDCTMQYDTVCKKQQCSSTNPVTKKRNTATCMKKPGPTPGSMVYGICKCF